VSEALAIAIEHDDGPMRRALASVSWPDASLGFDPEQVTGIKPRTQKCLPIAKSARNHEADGPGLGYDDLAIAEGESASRELMRLVVDDATLLPAERAVTREALKRYCERDTLAMVRVLARLRELA
jgi:hypothetical protein